MANDGDHSQQQTPESMPGPSDTTQTGAKYAYKQWASEVTLAFAEREWTNYLITPDDDPNNPDDDNVPDPVMDLGIEDPSVTSELVAIS
jgi:hypothetical protein